MSSIEFYIPGAYANPITPSDRGRTIAAFHLAQGDVDILTKQTEMRRDVLRDLMSPSAVGHWIKQGWLEKVRASGKVQLLRLTTEGMITCNNSVIGGGHMATTPEFVAGWRAKMKHGDGASFKPKKFEALPAEKGLVP